MVSSPETVDFAVLRLRAGVNHFKMRLLGGRHVAGQAQTQLVMDELSQSSSIGGLAPRTWASWFEQVPPRARMGTIAGLDRCASSISPQIAVGRDFYQRLIAGGLVQRLLAPTESKFPESVLRQRAAEYVPLTSLHLHLDAMEVASLSVGNGAVAWDVVKMIATSRVAEILHLLWNQRSGLIYSAVASDITDEAEPETNSTEVDSDSSSQVQFSRVLRAWEGKPRRPQAEAFAGQWDVSAMQVYRTLLALAADVHLLRGKVLEAWSLDLASAALMLHSSAWVKKHEVFTHENAPETIYLDALQSVYFRTASLEETVELLARVHEHGGFAWTLESYGKILFAQSAYRAALNELSISPALVEAAYHGCEDAHPLTFTTNQ